jgi:hypothetical protein
MNAHIHQQWSERCGTGVSVQSTEAEPFYVTSEAGWSSWRCGSPCRYSSGTTGLPDLISDFLHLVLTKIETTGCHQSGVRLTRRPTMTSRTHRASGPELASAGHLLGSGRGSSTETATVRRRHRDRAAHLLCLRHRHSESITPQLTAPEQFTKALLHRKRICSTLADTESYESRDH